MSNQTKHTPGPWRVKDNGSMEGPHVYGPVHPIDGGDYAPLAGYKGGALSEADARLIAAAPELLEACRQAAFAIPTTHGAFETVRAAIAKAEGRAT